MEKEVKIESKTCFESFKSLLLLSKALQVTEE